ncbi:MAG: ATP-grasp domain-containing protein [Candidatus Omnitrophota bacterium]
MKKLNTLVLFDSAGTPPENQDYTEQFKQEEWVAEAGVVETLNSLGHNVRILGIYDDIRLLVNEVNEYPPDVVFNLTEIFFGKACFDKNIPSLLELLNLPYTGCSPVGMMICNDKALSKKILAYHRIKVPWFRIFYKGKRVRLPKKLKFPLLVKPLQEEASTGISQASFVGNEKDLKERVEFIHEKFDMDAIVEEYIEGRELYVSVLGKRKLEVYPIREMKFTQVPEEEPKLATYKAKWDRKYRKKWGIKNEFAGRLAQGTAEKIMHICKKAYSLLGIDGYGRFDLRLTDKGDIYILEANANPELAMGDEFAESAGKAGISYDKLIQKILNHAFVR